MSKRTINEAISNCSAKKPSVQHGIEAIGCEIELNCITEKLNLDKVKVFCTCSKLLGTWKLSEIPESIRQELCISHGITPNQTNGGNKDETFSSSLQRR